MAIDAIINRRRLFGGAAALAGAAALFSRGAPAKSVSPDATLVSAGRFGEVNAGVVVDAEGLAAFSLPGRAHALTQLPSGKIVLTGRRPGNFAAIVDPRLSDFPTRLFAPIAGHRFAGHAAVSPDGRTLVTGEIDAETGAGAIAFRDAQSGAARAHYAAGIEPHDLLFARGGSRLVVAIGGIAKSAAVKGPALNLGHIESGVAELDPVSGRILKWHALPAGLESLSLRHMALAPDGETVVVGMQDQDRSELRPLIGILRLGRGIELLPLPAGDPGAMRFYVGSVTVDVSGRFAAATSPKGGMVGMWSLADGLWHGSFALADVCGLAPDAQPGCFWVSSGLGDLIKIRAHDAGIAAETRWHAPVAFDNHLIRI